MVIIHNAPVYGLPRIALQAARCVQRVPLEIITLVSSRRPDQDGDIASPRRLRARPQDVAHHRPSAQSELSLLGSAGSAPVTKDAADGEESHIRYGGNGHGYPKLGWVSL